MGFIFRKGSILVQCALCVKRPCKVKKKVMGCQIIKISKHSLFQQADPHFGGQVILTQARGLPSI